MQPHNTVGVMFKRRLRIHTADDLCTVGHAHAPTVIDTAAKSTCKHHRFKPC